MHGHRYPGGNMIVGSPTVPEDVGSTARLRVPPRVRLEFALGFSHPVTVVPPPGITFTVERPTLFHVAGIDKQQVGEVAANIRKIRPPEPYKGKGVKYQGEVIRRKAGKAGKK